MVTNSTSVWSTAGGGGPAAAASASASAPAGNSPGNLSSARSTEKSMRGAHTRLIGTPIPTSALRRLRGRSVHSAPHKTSASRPRHHRADLAALFNPDAVRDEAADPIFLAAALP